MPFEDVLKGVETLIHQGSEESRRPLSYHDQMNFGSGLTSSRLRVDQDLSFNATLPEETDLAFAKYRRWHRALGPAVADAAPAATMAAVGFPAGALLGRGVSPDQREPNPFNDGMESPLSNPAGTFGLTSKVDRILRIDTETDAVGDKPFVSLAKVLGGNQKAGGFLSTLGAHMVEEMRSWRQYQRQANDPLAGVKAVAMLASQIEFADEWPTFEFVGGAAPKVLKEWHRLVTTGSGNADLAVDGVMKFARAAEWIQHPELLIAPAVALSYMDLDGLEAEVGLKVAQWEGREVNELSDDDINKRVKALEALHPSGVVESLVDNVRALVEEAMGEPDADMEEFFWKARDNFTPLDLKEVGHVAGLNRQAPSTTQMRQAVRTVAGEAGEVNDQVVTPEIINGIAAATAARRNRPLPGAFVQLVTGAGLPRLGELANVDEGTDFTRYRDRPRNIRMESTPPSPKDSLTVTVEAAEDGTFKVMSEDGTSAFRNRAVGFIRHRGREATVPRRPAASRDARNDYARAMDENRSGSYFPLEADEHPAFGEGPQIMVQLKADGMNPDRDMRDRVNGVFSGTGLPFSTVDLPPHRGGLKRDGEMVDSALKGMVYKFEEVADFKRALADVGSDREIKKLIEEGVLVVQAYANTEMDKPSGMVTQWEDFYRDARGRAASVVSAGGLGSDLSRYPHFRFPSQAVDDEPMTGTNGLSAFDQTLPWSEGDTIHIYIGAYGSDEVPVMSHNEEDMGGYDPSRVVTATRRDNGNVVIAVPAEDGKVETMLAKQAHELMRSIGRKSISVVAGD